MTEVDVYFTRPGYEDLQTLETDLKDRVEAKLRDVRDEPGRYLQGLQGYDLHVLRVGDHRVILDWDRFEEVLYVHAVGHRRNVYDRNL